MNKGCTNQAKENIKNLNQRISRMITDISLYNGYGLPLNI